jgi:HPt (histidine-containing phosphotransfer) domain-containing protein
MSEMTREELLKAKLAELDGRFVQRAVRDRAELEQRWASGGLAQVAEIAHRIAGIAPTLGHSQLGQVAKSLEKSIRSEEPQHAIGLAFEQLLQALRTLSSSSSLAVGTSDADS